MKVHNYIKGVHIEGSNFEYKDLIDPSSSEKIGEVQVSNKEQTLQAIKAAEQTFSSWSNMAPIKRARLLFKYKEVIEKNIDKLAELISKQHGKTIEDSKGEIARGIEVIEFAVGIPHLLAGSHTDNVGSGVDSWSVRQALGVVGCVTPFNFPVMVPMWMFIPAIACGNTVVIKPAIFDPSSTILLAELAKEAGIPDGVINIANGEIEAVNTIIESDNCKSSFIL